MLEFKVKNQHLILLSTDKMVVADSQDYLKAKFTFSEDWDDVIKIALFVRDETRIREALDENNTCTIPYQVLAGEGKFEVSVIGNNQENADNMVITSSVVMLDVKRSGLLNGETFDESTAGLEGGVLHTITGKITEAQGKVDKAEAWAESNTEVEAGKYSAKHHAEMAEAAFTRCNQLAQQFDDVVNGPHYAYDNEGHLIFVYGREVG